MKFHEFGDKSFPHILLIHGGGNSWWNYLRQAKMLSEKYHVILPTLDGHGEECKKDYISTENSAKQIIDYIKENCDGKLFAIGGVSLGGQIAMEVLSLDSDIAQKSNNRWKYMYSSAKISKIKYYYFKNIWKIYVWQISK